MTVMFSQNGNYAHTVIRKIEAEERIQRKLCELFSNQKIQT